MTLIDRSSHAATSPMYSLQTTIPSIIHKTPYVRPPNVVSTVAMSDDFMHSDAFPPYPDKVCPDHHLRTPGPKSKGSADANAQELLQYAIPAESRCVGSAVVYDDVGRADYLPLRPFPLDFGGALDVIFEVCISSPIYLQGRSQRDQDKTWRC